MDAPETNSIGEWVRYLVSGVIGGAIMLVGIMRAWGKVERVAIAAGNLAEANAAMRDRDDLRIQALERSQSAAEERYTALLKGHERIEAKLDRLTDRLGG